MLRNIGSWRVKETDRLAAMATELRKLGAEVEEGPDYLRDHAARCASSRRTIDTYDDHRMAMCFSLAALGGVPVRINDPRCVAQDLSRLLQRIPSDGGRRALSAAGRAPTEPAGDGPPIVIPGRCRPRRALPSSG